MRYFTNPLFCFFLFISSIGFTQDSSNSIESTNVFGNYNDRFRFNEFGLALNPILVETFGARSWENRWALAYRRHLTEKISVRLISGFLFQPKNGFNNNTYGPSNYNTDSTFRYHKHYYSKNYKGFQINLGVQYNWGKKKLKWFTGMDLIYKNNHLTKLVDSISYDVANSVTNAPILIQKTETKGNHYGVFPFIGIRAMFNKHWGFTTHFGYNITVGYDRNYYFGTNSFPDNEGDDVRDFGFFIDANAFFQDVSLVFRF